MGWGNKKACGVLTNTQTRLRSAILMSVARPPFRIQGILNRHCVNAFSWQGCPTTRQQQLEVTRAMEDEFHEQLPQIPLACEHDTHERLGTVLASAKDPLSIEAQVDTPTTKRGEVIYDCIKNGLLHGLSLCHDPNPPMRVKEVSVCVKGAREGTWITQLDTNTGLYTRERDPSLPAPAVAASDDTHPSPLVFIAFAEPPRIIMSEVAASAATPAAASETPPPPPAAASTDDAAPMELDDGVKELVAAFPEFKEATDLASKKIPSAQDRSKLLSMMAGQLTELKQFREKQKVEEEKKETERQEARKARQLIYDRWLSANPKLQPEQRQTMATRFGNLDDDAQDLMLETVPRPKELEQIQASFSAASPLMSPPETSEPLGRLCVDNKALLAYKKYIESQAQPVATKAATPTLPEVQASASFSHYAPPTQRLPDVAASSASGMERDPFLDEGRPSARVPFARIANRFGRLAEVKASSAYETVSHDPLNGALKLKFDPKNYEQPAERGQACNFDAFGILDARQRLVYAECPTGKDVGRGAYRSTAGKSAQWAREFSQSVHDYKQHHMNGCHDMYEEQARQQRAMPRMGINC